MKRLRGWTAALLAWFFLLFNIERIHDPINLASFIYVLLAALAVVVVYFRRLRRVPGAWLYGLPVVLLLVLKPWLGYSLLGSSLPLTVTEICALVVTLGLARQVATTLDGFEEAAMDPILQHFSGLHVPFQGAQGDLYREVRRARRYGRPLALLAVSAGKQSVNVVLNRILQEIQREAVRRYVDARTADLLARQTKDCDIIAQRNHHFVVLLPETDHDTALQLQREIEGRAQQELGLKLQVGVATFPDQEVTLAGLLERAEGDMRLPNGAAHSPAIASRNSDARPIRVPK